MNYADLAAHDALSARAAASVAWSVPAPKRKAWETPRQGWLILILGAWNVSWIGFLIAQFITRTLA